MEWCFVNWVVFNDIDFYGKVFVQVGQLVGIFQGIVEILEGNVFVVDVVVCLLIVILQGFYECFQIVLFIDWYDFVVFGIVGSVEGEGEVDFYGIFCQLFDYFGNVCGVDGDVVG